MTAKKWLSRARRIDREINELLGMLQATRERLTKITQEFNRDTVSGSHDPHKYDKLLELEEKVDSRVDELIGVKAEILDMINQLPDRNQRICLCSYYLAMNTWEQTAVLLHYSYKQTLRIHGYALKEIDKLINREGDTVVNKTPS